MTEAAVQTVSSETADEAAARYPQRYFITVINAECCVFTYTARDGLIESIKESYCLFS